MKGDGGGGDADHSLYDGSCRKGAENKVKGMSCHRPEESPKHTAGPKPREEDWSGREVSSFKCHGQKKKKKDQTGAKVMDLFV